MLKRYEHDTIRELRIDRPPANALSPELLGALRDEMNTAAGDGVEAVVLSGRAGLFSAGLDVPYLLTVSREEIRTTWERLFGLMKDLSTAPMPVAAALTGHSPAGGAVLAICCDYRVMAEGDFRIGMNEVAVGIPMPLYIHQVLETLVGRRQAERLSVEGLMFNSKRAHAIGLVDELAPTDQVVERSISWCRSLLALPRAAMLTTRRAIRADLAEIGDEVTGETLDRLVEMWFSEETQGALRTLAEKLAAKG